MGQTGSQVFCPTTQQKRVFLPIHEGRSLRRPSGEPLLPPLSALKEARTCRPTHGVCRGHSEAVRKHSHPPQPGLPQWRPSAELKKMLKLPPKQSPGLDSFTGEFQKLYAKIFDINSTEPLPENRRGGNTSQLIYEATFILISKSDKGSTREGETGRERDRRKLHTSISHE